MIEFSYVMVCTCLLYVVVAMACGADLNQLSFVGLIGMWDPPRSGVKNAIAELLEGGVDVKMITGDAKETGEAIGESTLQSLCECMESPFTPHKPT